MRLPPRSPEWSEDDRDFLTRFVEAVRARIDPVAVVLFGSFARGEVRPDSDIDLLVVADDRDTLPLHRVLARIVIELRPRRDVNALPTNLRDMDPSFLRNVYRDGILLHGALLLTAEGLALEPRSLVSYDLSRLPPARRVRISRKVHGYSSKLPRRRSRTYRYPGLATRYNARRVSPSVLLMPSRDARRLAEELRALGARVTVRDLFEGP
ncbi:MAG TPA: nucleotidyltransferase domain-containing protein [Thermoplasmata archaeon]|nr:nucleotidyltransferase domain-containing protein [Thermoplasmata archaeon]